MKLLAIAVVAACVLAPAGIAHAQDTDDWEYGEAPANALTAAVSRYDSGHALVVQCRAGELTVVVQGMPLGDDLRHVEVVRADGRRDRQRWRASTAETGRALAPARAARLLRGGGVVQFRTAEGQPTVRLGFDLPSQSVNVDRVLTACGRPLEDERDAMPLFQGRLNENSFRRLDNRRDVQTPPTEDSAAAEVTCIVGDDLRLRDCRVEQAFPIGSHYAAEVAERLTGIAVDPANGQAAPGTVHHVEWTNMLIQVQAVEIEDRR